MKIIIGLLLISTIYSQPHQLLFGCGLGVGEAGVSVNSVFGTMISGNPHKKYFIMVGGYLFSNSRNDDNTYDFSPTLFDLDTDKGKIKEDLWITVGKVIKTKNNLQIYLSGGLNFHNEFYKRYDSSEILADDGIYYIKDDDSINSSPTLLLGITNKTENNVDFGIFYNTTPGNISIMVWFY